jgi:hypothetical protein
VLFFSSVASVLTACLLSIDESKLNQLQDDPEEGTPSPTYDAYVSPNPGPAPVKDAEAPIIAPDGARTCSPGLTLCPDDICYDTTGELKHCGNCTKECTPVEVCHKSMCGPPGSCKELLARVPGTASGVNNLTIQGTVLPAYCDMSPSEGGGFTLVYRVSAGIAGDPYALFIGGATNDSDTNEVTPLATQKHYVSRLLADWNVAFPAQDIRVRLLDAAGSVLKELAFDGTGSTRESWFSKGKLQNPPWTDVLNLPNGGGGTQPTVSSGPDPGLFSPAGHYNPERRNFYIEQPYYQCPSDRGWLLVHGSKATATCPYEDPSTNVRIFYAPGTTAQQWSSGTAATQEAASFAIFAR